MDAARADRDAEVRLEQGETRLRPVRTGPVPAARHDGSRCDDRHGLPLAGILGPAVLSGSLRRTVEREACSAVPALLLTGGGGRTTGVVHWRHQPRTVAG